MSSHVMAMQIISGGKKLIAQLNENWNANFLADFEENSLRPLGQTKTSHAKILKENLLFCVETGEKETSELLCSAALPRDGTLIMVNVSISF